LRMGVVLTVTYLAMSLMFSVSAWLSHSEAAKHMVPCYWLGLFIVIVALPGAGLCALYKWFKKTGDRAQGSLTHGCTQEFVCESMKKDDKDVV